MSASRFRGAAALACLSLAHCATSAPPRAAAPNARPRIAPVVAPSSIRGWIDQGTVRDEPSGAVLTVGSRLAVELGIDGTVRSLPNAQPAFRGQLGEPSHVHSLHLYTRAATDVHLRALDGPVVMTFPPGAFVEFQRFDGRAVELNYTSLSLLVDASALTTEEVPLGERPQFPNSQAEWLAERRPLSTTPDGEPFMMTPCLPLRILILEVVPHLSREPVRRIAMWSRRIDEPRRRSSFVLFGWIGAAGEERNCPPRFFRRAPDRPDDVPASFVRFDDAQRPDPGALFTRGGTAHALRYGPDDGELRCWALRVGRREMVERARFGNQEYVSRIDYSFENGQLTLGLTSSTQIRENGRVVESWGTSGMEYFTLVAATPEALHWLPGRAVFAYHPDDTERWFRTSAACEAARRGARPHAPHIPRGQ